MPFCILKHEPIAPGLRRFTKYHWYQVRILERLNKKKIRNRRTLLRDLQLALASAHDIVLLQAAEDLVADYSRWWAESRGE